MPRTPFLLADPIGFPPAETARSDGLLAIGGRLDPEWLLAAYRAGVFPWPDDDDEPVGWYCPDPRAVLAPVELCVTRRLERTIRAGRFEVRHDTAFESVVAACASVPRPGQHGTWITPRLRAAFSRLYELGWAHSAEAWRDGRLVGGVYGLAIGAVFFGESMFQTERDASKVAFAVLVRRLRAAGFSWVDAQVPSPHLAGFGVRPMRRAQFLRRLDAALRRDVRLPEWGARSRSP